MSAGRVFQTCNQCGIQLGIIDQYADGTAAREWHKLVGDSQERISYYKDFLLGLLREYGCAKVLDVACGTGIDSMMLLEEGFNVVSVDASDKMLKYALKARWDKRKDYIYDEWVIEEAKWETLPKDIQVFQSDASFDAIICLGNSFAHLLDENTQRKSLENFCEVLKPGGLLIIDHRNYDTMLNDGTTPGYSIYYNSKYPVNIKTSLLVVDGNPEVITLDYSIESPDETPTENINLHFYFYPHRLKSFTKLLDEAFNKHAAQHTIYADFQPLDSVANPAFYIHVVQKVR